MPVFLLLLFLATSLFAQEISLESNSTKKASQFFTAEGDFDVSGYLSEAYGFLPMPTLITEPAIGYGAGVGLIYLHDKFVGKMSSDGRRIPASMSGIIVMGTENGTTFYGGFHIGYWLEDRLRTISFVGYPNININFYKNNRAFLTNIKGPVFYQSVKGRLGDTNLFLGGGYLYSALQSSIEIDVLDRSFESKFTSAALELVAEYDARDNTLSPNDGYYFNAKAHLFREEVGGDNNYERYSAYGLYYLPVTETFTLDMKLSAESLVGEDAPFYAYPYISQRGMPVMRYQGQNIASAELQLRWEFIDRWSALLFGGTAKAFGKDQLGLEETSFNEAQTHYSKGVGFRYLVAEKFGLRMGVDVASSAQDKALYIQFGSAWGGF